MQRIMPQIDTVHISAPYGFTKLMTKKFANYKYKKNGILLDSGNKEVTRYVKDYLIDNTPVSFLVICMGKSDKSVEKKLDDVAESIKEDNRLRAMIGMANMSPLSLGVKI